jgi:ankyrin repeat protein
MAAPAGEVDGNVGVDLSTDDDSYSVYRAAENGDVEEVTYLLSLGANVEVGPENTPLCLAVERNDISMVRALIKGGANVNVMRETDLATPINIAAVNNNHEMIAPLVEAGADINMKLCGMSPVWVASNHGSSETLSALIDAGADFNAALERGEDGDLPPILLASFHGHEDCVQVLIEAGVDIDYTNSCGQSPIYMALSQCHVPVVKLLVSMGCNLGPLLEWVVATQPEVAEGGYNEADEEVIAWLAVYKVAKDYSTLCWLMPGSGEQQHQLFALKQLLVTYLGTSAPDSYIHSILRMHLRRRVPVWLADVYSLDQPTRRRLVVLCSKVYRGQVLARLGSRGASVVGAKACELIDLLLNRSLVRELLNLRLVCRCCEFERRFPVPPPREGFACAMAIPALEAGLVEAFVGGEVAFYVPTGALGAVLAIWDR